MNVYAIYFSPTKSTEKIVKILADEFGKYNDVDLCKKEGSFDFDFVKGDLCIIGVPSYGGRVPAVALDRMKDFKAEHTKTILVVSYGNRAYEDTVKELKDYVTAKGFSCIAAITAVAEHSIMHQFAAGRPDKEDEEQLVQFAKQISKKMENDTISDDLIVPGDTSYREYHGVPLKPKAGKKCSDCGLCAQSCPVGAIPLENPKITDKDVCISCMRCVEFCPSGARKVNRLLLKIASKKMKAVCADRKKNEIFI